MGRRRAFVLPAVPVFAAIVACDGGGSSDRVDEITSGLPGNAASVLVLDLETMAEHYDIDRDELGSLTDVRSDGMSQEDGSDETALLVSEISAAIAPFNVPTDNAHLQAIDVGEIDAVVSLPIEGLTVIATGQDSDALGDAYVDAGFEAEGDGRFGTAEPDGSRDIDGRYPAVSIDDGLLVLARSPEIRDEFGAGEGLSPSAQALFDAVGDDAWAVSVFGEADQEPGTCGAGQAFARSGDDIELLVLGGGEDVLTAETQPFFAVEMGSAQVDGDVTRYTVDPGDPSPRFPLLATSMEVSRVADC
ncbi:hypothetical protein [Phytoactinopolyspora endophytica]|uniref:hypothetical protein n=1 Tax=Phytoactinopolyspora endophytica TaxID=1642495 RepID=UPI00101BD58E|nr:hypothetical protein [Phytoactinopolyspora endophytica]